MRTEEQKALMQPIEVKFGAKKYPIQPLTMIPARDWRVELATVMGPISDNFQSTGAVSTGLSQALLQFPDKCAELVFSYAKDLPKEVIVKEATDEQLSEAFLQIMGVAYPYLASLVAVTRVIRPTSQQ